MRLKKIKLRDSLEETIISEFEKTYSQTSGIAVNIYYSKKRKKWVAYCFDSKKIEDPDLITLLGKMTDYINKRKYKFVKE